MIRGTTELVAHIGYPTHTFKSPMIYNPYFEQAGIDAVVVPMSCHAEQYPAFLKSVFTLTNVRGAIITMPHKVGTVSLLDEFTTRVEIAGSCNAVRRARDGRLEGDLFDGEGFVRGVRRKGCKLEGVRALVAGCGGVGSAIAASLAAAGVSAMTLFDSHADSARALAQRLALHYSRLEISTGSRDPAGHDLVVNATPLGMKEGDPMPMDVERIAPATFVGEVVLKEELTPFIKAVQARGCRYQVGTDMLFEQIPAYLEFFGFPATTAEVLRSVARIAY
ncbi:MAG: shikimate dehydrogenase family protein [Burkholderiales bacterium]